MKKNLFIIVLLYTIFVFGQDTKYLSENYEFVSNETAYLFGNDVKLREAPSSESEVIDLLKINEEIKIIEKTAFQQLYDGIDWHWYKVEYKDKLGYILGGLISLDRATLGNITFLVSLKKKD